MRKRTSALLLQVTGFNPQVAAHVPKKSRAQFLLWVFQRRRYSSEPNTPMAPFAEARLVLEAHAGATAQPLQLPRELAPSHSFSVAQICANCAPLWASAPSHRRRSAAPIVAAS